MGNNHRSCSTHCCILHGCKYGYFDCPVVVGTVEQEYLCQDCTEDEVKRCPHCGSLRTKWFANTIFNSEVMDGRYRGHDATPTMFLGCLSCSETIEHADTQEFLDQHINHDWDAIQSVANLEAIQGEPNG